MGLPVEFSVTVHEVQPSSKKPQQRGCAKDFDIMHRVLRDHDDAPILACRQCLVMAPTFLRVVAADRPPFVFLDSARSGNAQFYGLLVDLLPVLLSYGAAAADNTTLQYYAVPPSGGQLKHNGTWAGAVGSQPRWLPRHCCTAASC